jgi:hypothetical protein
MDFITRRGQEGITRKQSELEKVTHETNDNGADEASANKNLTTEYNTRAIKVDVSDVVSTDSVTGNANSTEGYLRLQAILHRRIPRMRLNACRTH